MMKFDALEQSNMPPAGVVVKLPPVKQLQVCIPVQTDGFGT